MGWASLILGGILGTVARYTVSTAAHKFWGNSLPVGTMTVNIAGCFLAGIFVSAGGGKFFMNHNLKLFLLVGFCGAFTTFSAFILETAHLLKEGQTFQALANLIVSVTAGFFIFKIGVLAGEMV